MFSLTKTTNFEQLLYFTSFLNKNTETLKPFLKLGKIWIYAETLSIIFVSD